MMTGISEPTWCLCQLQIVNKTPCTFHHPVSLGEKPCLLRLILFYVNVFLYIII